MVSLWNLVLIHLQQRQVEMTWVPVGSTAAEYLLMFTVGKVSYYSTTPQQSDWESNGQERKDINSTLPTNQLLVNRNKSIKMPQRYYWRNSADQGCYIPCLATGAYSPHSSSAVVLLGVPDYLPFGNPVLKVLSLQGYNYANKLFGWARSWHDRRIAKISKWPE